MRACPSSRTGPHFNSYTSLSLSGPILSKAGLLCKLRVLLAYSCHELCKSLIISCVSVEEVLHSVLILFYASLIILGKVAQIDLLSASESI